MTTYALADAASAPLDEVGGKAKTLGTMRRAGLTVPDGFVVTPGTDATAIAAATSGLGEGPFAVRSSGAAEDGEESSLAGRYTSFLDVDRSEVVDRVEDCRTAALATDGSRIAVIVQRQVAAKAAGVAFSADPVTGDRATAVVVATNGLAHRLVAGEVAGEEWAVQGRRARRRRRHGQKVIGRRLAKRVAALAATVAAIQGGPQDIEWAWDGTTLQLVQARPITALPPDADWTSPAPGGFNRSFRFGEWIGGPVTPLFEDWLLDLMEHRLHEVTREKIGQVALDPLHVVVNGWYFYSLNFLPLPFRPILRSLPSMLRLLVREPRHLAMTIPLTFRFGYDLVESEWLDDLEPRYLAAIEGAEASIETASADELVAIVDRLGRLAGEVFQSITVVAGSGYKAEFNLAAFWRRHLEGSHMDALAGLHRPDPTAPLIESIDWFHPIHDGAPTIPDETAVVARREAAVATARQSLSGRRLAKFDRLLSHAQHIATVREQQFESFARAWPVLRDAVLRLGEHLQRRGVIADRDDVFFLRRDEVASEVAGPVDERRSAWEAAGKLVPPKHVGRLTLGMRFLFFQARWYMGGRHSEAALVSGVPASPGTASGPVRVVRGRADFDRVRPGDVLVAPTTAPAWTPLFGRVAAVVTDIGTGLAHASIVAREFAIPSVVGCGDATARLTDGQWVKVDGTAGTVEPISPPPSQVDREDKTGHTPTPAR